MELSIIGTGNMARAIGARALAGGHDVTVYGKDSEHAEEAVTALGEAHGDGSATTAVSGDELRGDVVVLAVYYPDAREAVERYADQLNEKVVVDITNPVNESYDALVVPPDASATQELAAIAPGGRFVKAFNTTFANTLTTGQVAGQPLDVFVAGDDQDAKEKVTALVTDGGMRAIDVGGLGRARELEALGLLHMSVQGTLGTGFASAAKILP